jgi:DNA invertase Pin-like site-specific DNA recombinase
MRQMKQRSLGMPEPVWAYLVVSDPGQAHTLPDQERWAKDYALENGWRLTEIYSGVDSGKLGSRNICDRMVDDIEALHKEDRPTRILMIRLDRMGRGTGLGPPPQLFED